MTRSTDEQAYVELVCLHLMEIEKRERPEAINAEALSILPESADRAQRFFHAIKAFPGMKWAEFIDADKKRERKRTNPGKAGPPPKPILSKLNEPIARAAHDVDRIKAYWEATPDGMAGGDPPIPHIDLAAALHGISIADLGERVRRPKSRNPHKLTDRP